MLPSTLTCISFPSWKKNSIFVTNNVSQTLDCHVFLVVTGYQREWCWLEHIQGQGSSHCECRLPVVSCTFLLYCMMMPIVFLIFILQFFFCLVIMGFILKNILHALLGELMESVGDSLLAASHCHSWCSEMAWYFAPDIQKASTALIILVMSI
jgi:hypothetical protein